MGPLPNSAQGIFDYDKNCTAKGAAALFFRLLLPSHSQKFLVLDLEEIPLEKIPKFDNVSDTIEMGHFLIFIWSGAAEIERQIFFFLYKKFLVFNLEGISLQKISDFNNFY